MRKTTIVLVSILFATAIFMVKSVYATSCGYERYQDNLCEVYIQYFPIFPFDSTYPTASEEFAFRYYVYQMDKWNTYPVHWVASDFSIKVYFRDDSCGDNSYPTFQRWYPTSTTQDGKIYTWTLTGGYGPLSLGLTVSTQTSSFSDTYTKFPADLSYGTFMHLSDLIVDYHEQWTWGSTYTEGGGCIGVPNDLAASHKDHHVLVAVIFELGWKIYFTPYTYHETVTFILGDDIPSDTDCWLTVEQGDTTFTEGSSGGGGGGGGCPYVYTWDGQGYAKDNNLLPASEMSNGADVEDYYKLEQPLVPTTAYSLYSLQIREFEHEHDFIDQVKLIALDHTSDVKIAVTPKGEILTYKQPLAPLSCIDNNGTSRLNEVASMDGNISDTTTYFEGYPDDYLILNFGKIDAENAKLILRDDIKCMDVCIEVQVPSKTGDWQTVEVLNPRDYWAIEAVDLSKYVVKDEDLLVRLYWTSPHRLDYVGLDTSPQASIEVHQAFLLSAFHSTQGNVKPLLMKNDQTYTELIPGEQIQLAFLLQNNQNEERTFILYAEGHYGTIAP